jgi:hypothetical protein
VNYIVQQQKVRTYKAMNIDYKHQTSWFMNNKKNPLTFNEKNLTFTNWTQGFVAPLCIMQQPWDSKEGLGLKVLATCSYPSWKQKLLAMACQSM